jgi:hypothetical protein
MHTQLHDELARVMAADRIRQTPRAVIPQRRQNPPPLRGRVAYVAARLARRLDAETAKRAV